MATAVSLPGAGSTPLYSDSGTKARDLWAAVLFWVHVIAIAGVGFALGPSAIQTDSAQTEDDPTRPALHINAYTIIKVVIASCGVSAVVAAAAFACLKRAGGAFMLPVVELSPVDQLELELPSSAALNGLAMVRR